jgi:hypothetical protein
MDLWNGQLDTAYYARSADGVHWAIGTQDVMAFEGSNWTCIA